ncbi:MAG: hypothetical protein IT233_06815 [Bacteroidia bacterium]|nr:hypothetical protein [Bacteroidia bacterium]
MGKFKGHSGQTREPPTFDGTVLKLKIINKTKKYNMKKIIPQTIILATSLLISSCGSNSDKTNQQTSNTSTENTQQKTESTPPQETQIQKKIETEWVKIKSWKGTGIKKTEKFTIKEGDWRIVWNFSSPQDMTVFQIAYYKSGSEEPEDYVANVSNELKGGDTSYVHTTGEFYLEMNAANCNWKVSIEEEKEKK